MTPPEGATAGAGVWECGRDAGVIHEDAVEAGETTPSEGTFRYDTQNRKVWHTKLESSHYASTLSLRIVFKN